MSNVKPVNEVMHRIRVKLYPGYLPGIRGAYIAKTDPEAVLGIEEICTYLYKRGGYTGSYEDLVKCVRQFFDELVYQLCNGFAADTGYFSIHPSVGGVFRSDKDGWDPKEHPVSFTFRIKGKLRRAVEFVSVEIEGIEDGAGCIDEFHDIDEDSKNAFYAPGSMVVITGDKIKVAGNDPARGVYLVPVDDPSKAVKLEPLVGNTPTKIIGRAPQTGYRHNRIEIRTGYTGSGTIFLKELRTITSDFILEEL